MSCDYKKYINLLLDGKISNTDLEELECHAKTCKECTEKLKMIKLTDDFIKKEFDRVPFTSKKSQTIENIKSKKNNKLLPILYKSRKFICGAAAIFILILAIHLLVPYVNSNRSIAQSTNHPVETIATPTKTNTNANTSNTQPIDINKLNIKMPANWSYKINNRTSILFYNNGVENGGLSINNINKDVPLIQNITPNHSDTLWTEEINVPLGKGQMAAFKITSPQAEPVQTVEYEINAIIPISEDQAYEIGFTAKDASDESKTLFMDMLNNIKY